MLTPSLALLISIAGILILLRFKWYPGFAIFAGSLILSLLVQPANTIPSVMLQSLWNYQTIRLLVVVASALTLSRFMEVKGLLANLATVLENTSPKLAIHFIPAVIGLVPMPGGALVSATASKGLLKRLGLTPERSTFINYWFRHFWEFSIPVYPSIIATSVLLAIPFSFILATMFPVTILFISVGSIISYVFLKNIPKTKAVSSSKVPLKIMVLDFLKAAWPILFLLLSVLLGLDAIIAFPVALVLLLLQQRAKRPELGKSFKYGLDPKTLFLLYAVMLYKTIIENSNAAEAVFLDMQTLGLPVLVILAILPFLIGFVTGISIAFVGIAFPLLVPFIKSELGVNGYALLLAYTSGMMGLLLSPLHLCLILSTQYFKASLLKVYRYLVIPAIIIEAIAILVYYFMS
jgi:integral membrane protein (TIGR00529 family)